MRNSFLIVTVFWFNAALAQLPTAPLDLPQYDFIEYTANHFDLVQDNPAYSNLFAKFDSLVTTGENQIKIVHIGGSHIQADIYTHRIRQEMQSFYPGILGARGFFFPYKIAQTNSPDNLSIGYTGEWVSCKNTQADAPFTLGISGITSELISKHGSITVVARFDSTHTYDFNRIRVFCNVTDTLNLPELSSGTLVHKTSINQAGTFLQYDLSAYSDTFCLTIRQQDTLNKPFQLYGISLENDDPGVIYNAIGVNGAMLSSYLRCNLFCRQLKALDPDWVILSIGTNEGNTKTFDEESYRHNYIRLIDSVKTTVPRAAILLTVPNDCYFHKRYVNPNTAIMRNIIYSIAGSEACGVWDLYTIMGGLNSVRRWFDEGLMGKDHIHFSKKGYLLKGELFYSAFLSTWDDPHFNHNLSVAKP